MSVIFALNPVEPDSEGNLNRAAAAPPVAALTTLQRRQERMSRAAMQSPFIGAPLSGAQTLDLWAWRC